MIKLVLQILGYSTAIAFWTACRSKNYSLRPKKNAIVGIMPVKFAKV
jgi:hypothetical protein